MRGGTLLALIQEKPTSIAGHGAQGEQGRTGAGSFERRDLSERPFGIDHWKGNQISLLASVVS